MKKYLILLEILFNRVKYNLLFGEKSKIRNIYTEGNFTLDISKKTFQEIIIDSANFRKYCAIRIRNNGFLKIGNGVFFNSFCSINCLDNIIIGNNCVFGENVKIYDHNHKFSSGLILIREQGYSTSPITVGNNCWIGSNVTILKGAKIGDNVVIGAGSTISEKIPSNSVVKNSSDLMIEKLKWKDQ